MASPVSDDKRRLDSWNKVQRELMPGETVMDRLAFLRSMQRWSGWRHTGFTRDSHGEITFGASLPHVPHYPSGSPEATTQARDWQERTLAMMAAQGRVELADKPLNRDGLRPSGSAVATFERAATPAEIPAFHESPGATETKRGN